MPASGLSVPLSNALELAGDITDWVGPLVAALEQVRRPFGCALLTIALDSDKSPEYYEKLLRRNGVKVLGIQLSEGFSLGDFICDGCACMTILRKHYRKAVRLLTRHGAIFVYEVAV